MPIGLYPLELARPFFLECPSKESRRPIKKMPRGDAQAHNRLKTVKKAALRKGNRPRRAARSGRVILSTGEGGKQSYRVLIGADGTLTPAGRVYQEANPSWQRPAAFFDPNQLVIRRGPSDSIRTDAGERVVRTYDVGGRTRLTRLGKLYFRGKKTEYVVKIPVIVKGWRADGSIYYRNTHMPTNMAAGDGSFMEAWDAGERFREDAALGPAEAVERIKTRRLERWGQDFRGGRTLIFNQSQEEWYYDRDGEWLVSALTLQDTDGDGQLEENVRMDMPLGDFPAAEPEEAVEDQAEGVEVKEEPVEEATEEPLGALPPSCGEFLPFPEQIIPEAWERHDDKLCVPRQLAVILGKSLENVMLEFEDLGPGWESVGVSANQLHAWCVANGHPFFFWSGGRIIKKFEPKIKQRGKRAIAVAAFGAHAFFYKSARFLAAKQARGNTRNSEDAVIQNEYRPSEAPPASEWLAFPDPIPEEGLKPGWYYCSDLTQARRALLETGRLARVTMKSFEYPSKLSYFCAPGRDQQGAKRCHRVHVKEEPTVTIGHPNGARVVHGLRCALQHWLANVTEVTGHRIPYRMEGLPALALTVFQTVMRARRLYLPDSDKKAILYAQKNACVMCGGEFSEDETPEYDHIVPLRSACEEEANVLSNFQALHSHCHAEKSALEGRSEFNLNSRFSKRTWEQFVRRQEGVRALIYRARKEDGKLGTEVDIKRCRRQCMAYADHDFCVFSPLDNIEAAVPGEMADFMYIAEMTPRRGRHSPLTNNPFCGRGWYHRVAVEFMFHHGMISWDDVRYKFNATARIPVASVRRTLETMEQCWEGVDFGKDLSKMSINQMVGLMGREAEARFSCTTSWTDADVPPNKAVCATRVVEYSGGFVYDFLHRTPLVGNRTTLPIYLQIIWTERTRLAELHKMILAAKVPPQYISHANTDCVRFENLPVKHRRPLKELCEKTTYRELWRVRAGQVFPKIPHDREESKHPPYPHKLPLCFHFEE